LTGAAVGGGATTSSNNAATQNLQSLISEAQSGMGRQRPDGSFLLDREVMGDQYGGLSDRELAALGVKRESGTFGTNYVYTPPARALGGPVAKGSEYLVGETGPEKFTAGQDGMITPLKPVPVTISGAAFKDMNERLDLLARINGAMLNAMERNNSLTRQGQMLSS